MFNSLKNSLRFSIIVFSLLLTLCFISLMLAYAWVVEDNVFNRLVKAEAQNIINYYQDNGIIIEPSQPFMRLYANWQSLPEEVQSLHLKYPNRIEFPNGFGGTFHIQNLLIDNNNWILVADVTSFEVTRDYLPKLLPYLAFALVIVLVSAFLISSYLSLKIIRPLTKISTRVKLHKPGSSLVLEDILPDNEIGYLGHTIQRNMALIETALARETDFTRDISHELRTPTTILKMAISRLNEMQPPHKETLVKLEHSVLQIEHTIHILLALAREESEHRQKHFLLEEIEYCLVNNPKFTNELNLTLSMDIEPNYQIVSNKNLLHILLNNIIENVFNHASSYELNICLKDDLLQIANPMSKETPDFILKPGVKSHSSEGIGQGLHLVCRICQRNNWKLDSKIDSNWFYLTIDFSADRGTFD